MQITSQNYSFISDDSDQWSVGALGCSPLLRQGECGEEKRPKARDLAAQLVVIGEPSSRRWRSR